MLLHSLEFAEQHRFLGRASEAQIESYHRAYNELFNEHHLNMTHNDAERQRRSLADTTLRAVQFILQQ
jgi:DnaJ-domain-containing protein 1